MPLVDDTLCRSAVSGLATCERVRLPRGVRMTTAIAPGSRIGALLLVLIGALAWGVYWIPIRFLEQNGLPGIWSGLVMTSAAFLCALMVCLVRGTRRPDAVQIIAASLIGVAFAFYGASLAYTDVVRAILLFYLTPIWSMLIACAFLGRRWGLSSTIAIVVALAGIICIFRGELPLDGIGAVGDWMSLAAGVAWSVASTLVFSHGQIHVVSMSTWSLGASAVVSGAVVLVLGEDVSSVLAGAAFDAWRIGWMALLIGAVYVVPVMFVTLWGASQFSAVVLGFLLTGEIVSGVVSSAIFLGEQFGWPEVVGTLLIICGACTEIFGSDQNVSADTTTTRS